MLEFATLVIAVCRRLPLLPHAPAAAAHSAPHLDGRAMYLSCFYALMLTTGVASYLEARLVDAPEKAVPSKHDPDDATSAKRDAGSFSYFQANYLLVYLLAVAADWIQGPYVYALYTHYGYDKKAVGHLYIAGFASSAVFGTIVGSLADKYGRRNSALMYCAVYIVSCVTKHSSNFNVLLFGRLCGGVATSILFSAFESWMVYEHFARRFAPRLLSATFARAQFGNGIVAITAGLVAEKFASMYGKVAPFDVSAVVLLALAGVLAYSWTENYGDATTSVAGGLGRAWKTLCSDERIVLLGITQAAFESALYVFTFVWTPALQLSRSTTAEIPHGTIFSTFMAATMMGSSLFAVATRYVRVEVLMRVIFAVGFLAFASAFHAESLPVVYASFVVFEVLCGVYFPAMATLRSPYIPEESRSALLNFFRVPLNVIVVVTLYEDLEISTVFALCAALMLCGLASQMRLRQLAKNESSTQLKPLVQP